MTVHQFRLPDVGEGLLEADVLSWHVAVGDTVEEDQTIVEIETAKSAVELPSPWAGTVTELLVQTGDTVAVGTPIIAISTDANADTGLDAPAPVGDPPSDATPAPDSVDAASSEPAEPKPSVLVGYGPSEGATKRRQRKPAASTNGNHASYGAQGTVAVLARAKPPVRKFARDLGVDLALVDGTGKNDTITREDVQRHAENKGAPTTPVGADLAAKPAASSRDDRDELATRIPVKGVRKATAAAMSASAFTAPHVTEFVTVDVTRSVRLVDKLKAEPAFDGSKVTMLLLVARALLAAVRKYPDINASWDAEANEIVLHHWINLGIAAATPRGLLVPNIKDAGAQSLPELAASLTNLVRVARDGKTSPEDMSRGTITITNIGVFGVDAGTPILNPGEAAILCVGAVRQSPWAHRGKIKLRWTTQLALSFDHRLVDGALGSQVLARVGKILENPKWELLLG